MLAIFLLITVLNILYKPIVSQSYTTKLFPLFSFQKWDFRGNIDSRCYELIILKRLFLFVMLDTETGNTLSWRFIPTATSCCAWLLFILLH